MKDEAANENLRRRTKRYALQIIRLYQELPRTAVAQTIGRQLLRAGTTPGAQYREACRAKSTADFISKVEGALQELDEAAYWLELLSEGGVVPPDSLNGLNRETEELIAILVTVVKNAKRIG